MKQLLFPELKTKRFSADWYENLINLEQERSISRQYAYYLETISRFLDFGNRYFFDRHDWEFWIANRLNTLHSFTKSNYQQRLKQVRKILTLHCHEAISIRAVLGSVHPHLLKEEFISSNEFNGFANDFTKVFESNFTDKATLKEAQEQWYAMFTLTLQKIAGAASVKSYTTQQKKYMAYIKSFVEGEGNMENGKYLLFHILTTGDLSSIN